MKKFFRHIFEVSLIVWLFPYICLDDMLTKDKEDDDEREAEYLGKITW